MSLSESAGLKPFGGMAIVVVPNGSLTGRPLAADEIRSPPGARNPSPSAVLVQA